MMQSGTPAVTADGQQKDMSCKADTEAAREDTSKADKASSSIPGANQ